MAGYCVTSTLAVSGEWKVSVLRQTRDCKKSSIPLRYQVNGKRDDANKPSSVIILASPCHQYLAVSGEWKMLCGVVPRRHAVINTLAVLGEWKDAVGAA